MICQVIKISESKKSALVIAKSSVHSFGGTLVYVPNKEFKLKDTFEVPDNTPIQPWITKNEQGALSPRTTKSGTPLMVFA